MSTEQEAGAPPDRAAPPLLEVRDIEKTFPGVRALSGVSFDVRPGEVHALLGENGAGKSTLIKIVSGVYQPDLGSILVNGKQVDFSSPDDARRAGVATIYQELLLFPELSVAENIFLGHAPLAGAGRIDWRAMRDEAERLLDSLEIDDLSPDQIVGVLTVGNRQRVEILRALSHDARILIMDEPTAALTESDVTRLFDVVRRLKQRGVGIVYISHRLDEIFAIADRVTVLRDGAYVGSRDVADTNVGELVQMMVGRRLESSLPEDGRADRRAGPRSARSRAPAAHEGRQPHSARGRDRRPCGARRFGPQRTRADAVRHDAERVRRRFGSTAKACGSTRPKPRAQKASPTCRKIAARRVWSGG